MFTVVVGNDLRGDEAAEILVSLVVDSGPAERHRLQRVDGLGVQERHRGLGGVSVHVRVGELDVLVGFRVGERR